MALTGTRTLTQVLDDETARVTAGTATACAALPPDPTITACQRIATHPVDGEAARESHAGHQPDNPDQPDSPTHWATWTD